MSKKKKNNKKKKKTSCDKLNDIKIQKSCAEVNKSVQENLLIALEKGDLTSVQLHFKFPNKRLGYHLLQTSIEHNQEQIALWLISSGCIVNRIDDNDLSDTPLHVAISKNVDSIIKSLLEKNASVDAKNIKGETPLHISCKSANVSVTKLLLSKNAATNTRDCCLKTPLHIGVEQNSIEIVKLLLNYEVNINAYTIEPCFEGFTPLHMAVINKNTEIIKILLENNADINASLLFEKNNHNQQFSCMKFGGYTPLHLAVEMGDIDVIKLLLDCYSHEIKINYAGLTPFHVALEKENFEAIQILLNLKLNIDFYSNINYFKGQTLLHIAIIKNNKKIVKLLLDNGADIDSPIKFSQYIEKSKNDSSYLYLEGFTPLQLAVEFTDKDMIKLLLDYHPDATKTDVKGFTPLHIAVKKNLIEIVDILLRYKKEMNLIDDKKYCRGLTPFHIATINGNLNISKILLENGADVNEAITVWCINSHVDNSLIPYVKYKDYSPLHVAVKNNDVLMVELLLKFGAKINATVRDNNMTPLHLSVKEKNKNIFYILLNNKANFKSKTTYGKNILHLAIENNWPELLEEFLDKDLNVDDTTADTETLLSLAVKKKNKYIIELLLKMNASDINKRDSNGQSPLHIAVFNVLNDIVRMLLNFGADVDILNNRNETPLCIAVKNNDPEIVSELLKFKPSTKDINNKYAFFFAIKNCENYMKIINLLFLYGFEITSGNYNNINLLNLSVQEGYFSLAEYFSKHVVDKPQIHFLVHDAVKRQSIRELIFLINEKYNLNIIDNYGKTPADYAIKNNDLAMLELLLTNGAKFTDICAHFLESAKKNNEELCKILLNSGVNINLSNEFGTTALHFATWNKNLRFIKILLYNKAFVNTTKNFVENTFNNKLINENVTRHCNGYYTNEFKRRMFTSPLHLAISKKRKDICDILINYCADVNAQDGFGRTALHFAASIKSPDQEKLILKLINCGADINLFDNNKKLPIHYVYYPICMCNLAFQNQYELYCECECNIGDDDDDDDDNRIISLFVKYITLLICMNKNVHKDNLKLISGYNFSENLKIECLLEIKKMKKEKIGNYVSFYDILTKNSLSYVQNEEIIKIFQSNLFKNKFPLYFELMKENFENLQLKRKIIKSAINSLNIFAPFKLPEDISQSILENLFLNDLNSLIEASKLLYHNTNVSQSYSLN